MSSVFFWDGWGGNEIFFDDEMGEEEGGVVEQIVGVVRILRVLNSYAGNIFIGM